MATKHFWMKFNENFFESQKMVWLETQPNGEKYIILWQKLLLLCIKSSREDDFEMGFLRFSKDIPYDPQLLAKVLRVEIEIVTIGIQMFQKAGMIEILNDNTIYIEGVSKIVGKESESAIRMRRLREKRALSLEHKPNTERHNVTGDDVTGDTILNLEQQKSKRGVQDYFLKDEEKKEPTHTDSSKPPFQKRPFAPAAPKYVDPPDMHKKETAEEIEARIAKREAELAATRAEAARKQAEERFAVRGI